MYKKKKCPTEFEEGSPQWPLWQQQLQHASKNDSNQCVGIP